MNGYQALTMPFSFCYAHIVVSTSFSLIFTTYSVHVIEAESSIYIHVCSVMHNMMF